MKIYYAKIEHLSENEKKKALSLLPRERVERIRHMKAEKSQQQSITAGLLLEYAFREMGLSGKELTFLKNADGKPYIKEVSELHYNLSHSGEYAALVMDTYPVGIDIEGAHEGGQKLVKRFFSEEEKKILLNHWSEEAFTRFWTRKESYLKAVGFGMRMPLDGFSVHEERVQINEKMTAGMVSTEDAYYIESFQLEGSFWLSVCRKDVTIREAAPQIIELREIIKGKEDV